MLQPFVGEWEGSAEAASIVDTAIERATSAMSTFVRGIARSLLQTRNAPPARIGMNYDDGFVEFAFGRAPAHRLPLSGEAVQQGQISLRLRVEPAPEVALHHIAETGEGTRESIFRVNASSDGLTMDVTVTSPRLPEPVRYTLQFSRLV